MAGTGVGKFSSTASSNTANMTVNFAENMAPSNVNNAARELMGHMRDMYEQLGDGYFEFGDGDGTYTVARGDADTITITSASDISGIYFAGRKIRITDGGANVVEGTIASSSHSSTTQTVNLTGISLASGTPTKVELGIDTAAFGGRVILDDDGDTYIEAPTDDTIDIYVAGAKDFVITANDFTAQSGSVISTDNINETTSGSGVTIDGVLLKDGNITMSGLAAGSGITLDLAGSDNYIIEESSTNDVIDFGQGGSSTKFSHNISSGALTIRGASTITTADNTDTLSLISTDADAGVGPNIVYYRNSSSPANDDYLGEVTFRGRNNNSQDVDFARINARLKDVADGSEDAQIIFNVMTAGSEVETLRFGEGATVFNEGSADQDFRVESNSNTHQLFVDGGNNCVMIEQNASPGTRALPNAESPILQIKGNSASSAAMLVSKHSADSSPPAFYFYKSRNTSPGAFTIINDGDTVGSISMFADDGTDANSSVVAIEGQIDGTPGANDTPGRLLFYTTADGANGVSERMRIHSDGNISIGRTTVDTTNAGISLEAGGTGVFVRSGGPCVIANRLADDGEIIRLVQAGTTEGTISVSGSTVSYNAFTGSHWSRLADNSKPSILVGTIMESLDSMINWYQAVADVAEVKYTAEDQAVIDGDKNVGDVKTEAHTIKEEIALPDGKSVGDAVTFTHYGTEYTGVYAKENDVKHVHSKVSDSADSTRVYGVFHCWGNDNVADVNDMEIAQVGTYIIRVHKDVTVSAGDLLVSNGDGTAKKQDDDIIRSKTVAKVNSNIKVETYADGSYTVPCTLHC